MKNLFALFLCLCLLLPMAALAVENFNPEGLPVVNEPITLRIAVAIDSDMKDYDEMELVKRWQEETGIDVEWIQFDTASWTEKKNLMLINGEIPDLIFGSMSEYDVLSYADQGYWLPLQDLIAEYSVNMKSFSERYPDIYNTWFAPDGNLYKIPRHKGQEDMVWPNRMYINQTWLDKLGLATPTTLDELTEVLRAFKTQDPNGNGLQDEIPFAFRTNDPKPTRTSFNRHALYGFFGTFGRLDAPDHIVLENDKPIFTADKEEYKKAVEWLHMAYTEGLIDPEAFTMDTATYKAKNTASENVYGVWTGWTVEEATNPPEQGIIDYKMLEPLTNSNGEKIWPRFGYYVSASSGSIMVSAFNKYPEATIRFLDYLWDPYFSIEMDWGIEGVGSIINDDGTWEILGGGLKAARTAEGMAWNVGTNVPMDIYEKCIYTSKVKQFEMDACGVYRPYGEEMYPGIYFTLEDTQEMQQYFTDIVTYVDKMTAAWVINGGIDEQWDEYLSTLDRMGLKRYVEIYETNYARYNAE